MTDDVLSSTYRISYHETSAEKEEIGGSRGDYYTSRRSEERRKHLPAVEKPKLRRQSTFVVEDEEDDNDDVVGGWKRGGNDLLSSTLHTGGIKSILERANRHVVFPDEVKSYINSHFRMIKDENDSLRQSLEEKSYQLDKIAREHEKCRVREKDLDRLEDKLASANKQLDKEKAKMKSMMRRVKEGDGPKDEDNNVVVWMGAQKVREESKLKERNSNGDGRPLWNNSTESRPQSGGSENGDSRTAKKIKGYKNQITGLEREIDRMKDVREFFYVNTILYTNMVYIFSDSFTRVGVGKCGEICTV